MESVHEHQFIATYSQIDIRVDFDEAILTHSYILYLESVHCSSDCMSKVLILLEGVHSPPISSVSQPLKDFVPGITQHLAPFIFKSTSSVPTNDKHPQSVMLPPPCFTTGWIFFSERYSVIVFPHTDHFVHLTRFRMFAVFSAWMKANFKCVLLFF